MCPPRLDHCPLTSFCSVASTRILSWRPGTRRGLRAFLTPVISLNTPAKEALAQYASEYSVQSPWLAMGLTSGTEGQCRTSESRPEETWQLLPQSLGILCQERSCHSGRHLSALQVPCDRGHATCVWGPQGNECSTRASASRHPGPGHTCGRRSLPIPQPSLDCSLQGEMSCSRSSDGTIFVLTAPSQYARGWHALQLQMSRVYSLI